MKKILISVVVFVTLILGLTACNKNNSIKVENAEDLIGANIAVQEGTIGADLADGIEDATVEKYKTGAEAILALKQGKVDAVVIDDAPAKKFVEKNKDLKILEEKLSEEDYAMAINKENSDLTEMINGALAELKEEGTLDQIINSWLGDDKGANAYTPSTTNTGENGNLVVATSANFPPYEHKNDNNEIVGLDISVIQAVCDKLNKTYEIEDMEFGAVITSVNTKKCDIAISGITVTDERKKSVDFTDTYITASQVIIVQDEDGAVEKVGFFTKIKNTLITNNGWKMLLEGLGNTILIALFSIILGIVIGFLVAIIRTTHDKTGRWKIADKISRVYLAIFRGTPVVVQLLIIYFGIFASVNVNKIFVAIIAFGINSGAYVAEIVRSGIMSIDDGQFEAGSSLGMSYGKTMIHVVLPQAIKNILPALGNEFIVLLKETSIAGYIAIFDLTKAGDQIRSSTYEAFIPLIAVAIIYFIIVMGLSKLISILERRLSKNDKH